MLKRIKIDIVDIQTGALNFHEIKETRWSVNRFVTETEKKTRHISGIRKYSITYLGRN